VWKPDLAVERSEPVHRIGRPLPSPHLAWAVDSWGVLLLILLGLAVRLRGLVVPARGLWIDEAFSIWLAELPPLRAVQVIASIDQHPPLYALLLHFWLTAGDDPWWVRLPSVFVGTATIPVAARLARTVAGRRAGLIAGVLFAFSPVLVRYAQEARMYALVVLETALMALFLVRAVDQPERRDCWLGLGLSVLLLLYTHNITLFLVLSAATFLLWRAGSQPCIRRPMLVTTGGVMLAWLPWVPVLVHQSAGVIQRFWIKMPGPAEVADTLQDLVDAFPPMVVSIAGLSVPVGRLGPFLLLPFALLALVGERRWRRRPVGLFLVIFAGPLLMDLGLSLWRPIFEERVLLYTVVGILLLVALGIAAPRRGIWSGILLGAVLALYLGSLETYNREFAKERWQDVAAYVAGHAQAGDLILFNATWTQLPFDYYYHRDQGPWLVEHGLPVDLFDRGLLEPPMLESDVPTVARLTASVDHAWLILSHDWYNDPRHLIRPAMRALFQREEVHEFGNILLIRYQR
jgi:mannosyltransferase